MRETIATIVAPIDIRRFLARLLWVLWGGTIAAAVVAAPTPVFTASASGTTGSLTITANLQVGDPDVGANGNIYLVANVHDAWYAHNGTAWESWQGGSIPAYFSGALADRSIEVVRNLDSSAFSGTRVFLGYGRDEADMLGNSRYGLIYQVAAPVAEARSSLPRNGSTAPADADRQALTAGNARFALDLYRQLLTDPAQSGGNLFFSPLSLSVALAMTHAGARGGTADEMADALHFTLPRERLHPAFGWLDLEMAQRGQGAQGRDGQPFRLSVANSLWGELQTRFEAPFLDTLALNYGAGINLVDFIASPDPSRVRINDWVAEKTEQRIRDLLPQGSVTSDTRMVLVNTVYFNAAWQNRFDTSASASATFTRLDGSIGTVSMMNQSVSLRYAAGSDYQAVELPYDGNELAMLVILPTAGQFLSFEQSFDTTRLTAIQAALSSRTVRLGLPKFKLDGGFSVKAAMQGLGMRIAFTDAADFSGISTSEAVKIQDILHKSFAEIDENGTEAAAATAVVMAGVTSVPSEPIAFTADRPFLFAIVDQPTNTLVFLGRVIAL